MKINYVCPFAHYSGHHPHVAGLEPIALKQLGHDVTLSTFQGIINDTYVDIKHKKIIHNQTIKKNLYRLRQHTLLRWWLMVLETFIVIGKAIVDIDKYDVTYIRDGDPFLFVVFSELLLLKKRHKIAISVTGSAVFAPKIKHWYKHTLSTIYTVALYLIVHPVWKPLYSAVIKQHDIMMIAQNDRVVKAFSNRANHVFKDVLHKVSRGVSEDIPIISQQEARKKLDIPDKFTILSFGAPHQGKNLNIVFHAVSEIPDIQIVHGGMHNYSLGGNPADMAKKYRLDGRSKIFDYFIPENEKINFFGAANVVVLSYTTVFGSTSSMLYEAARFGVPVIASNNHPLMD